MPFSGSDCENSGLSTASSPRLAAMSFSIVLPIAASRSSWSALRARSAPARSLSDFDQNMASADLLGMSEHRLQVSIVIILDVLVGGSRLRRHCCHIVLYIFDLDAIWLAKRLLVFIVIVTNLLLGRLD